MPEENKKPLTREQKAEWLIQAKKKTGASTTEINAVAEKFGVTPDKTTATVNGTPEKKSAPKSNLSEGNLNAISKLFGSDSNNGYSDAYTQMSNGRFDNAIETLDKSGDADMWKELGKITTELNSLLTTHGVDVNKDGGVVFKNVKSNEEFDKVAGQITELQSNWMQTFENAKFNLNNKQVGDSWRSKTAKETKLVFDDKRHELVTQRDWDKNRNQIYKANFAVEDLSDDDKSRGHTLAMSAINSPDESTLKAGAGFIKTWYDNTVKFANSNYVKNFKSNTQWVDNKHTAYNATLTMLELGIRGEGIGNFNVEKLTRLKESLEKSEGSDEWFSDVNNKNKLSDLSSQLTPEQSFAFYKRMSAISKAPTAHNKTGSNNFEINTSLFSGAEKKQLDDWNNTLQRGLDDENAMRGIVGDFSYTALKKIEDKGMLPKITGFTDKSTVTKAGSSFFGMDKLDRISGGAASRDYEIYVDPNFSKNKDGALQNAAAYFMVNGTGDFHSAERIWNDFKKKSKGSLTEEFIAQKIRTYGVDEYSKESNFDNIEGAEKTKLLNGWAKEFQEIYDFTKNHSSFIGFKFNYDIARKALTEEFSETKAAEIYGRASKEAGFQNGGFYSLQNKGISFDVSASEGEAKVKNKNAFNIVEGLLNQISEDRDAGSFKKDGSIVSQSSAKVVAMPGNLDNSFDPTKSFGFWDEVGSVIGGPGNLAGKSPNDITNADTLEEMLTKYKNDKDGDYNLTYHNATGHKDFKGYTFEKIDDNGNVKQAVTFYVNKDVAKNTGDLFVNSEYNDSANQILAMRGRYSISQYEDLAGVDPKTNRNRVSNLEIINHQGRMAIRFNAYDSESGIYDDEKIHSLGTIDKYNVSDVVEFAKNYMQRLNGDMFQRN